MAGRSASSTYLVSIYSKDGKPYRWRVFIPTFQDGIPIAGKRQQYFFDLRLSKKQVETLAKQLYLDALQGLDGEQVQRDQLLTACLEYYQDVTCGPAPKSVGTQKMEWMTIRDLACWLADRHADQEHQPSRPEAILGRGADRQARGVQDVAVTMDIPLRDLSLSDLTAWRNYLARRFSATSVNIEIRHLRAILRWLHKQERVRPLDMASLLLDTRKDTQGGKAKKTKRTYSRVELQTVIQTLECEDPEAALYCRLAYLTGARAKELASLTPSCIDEERGLLLIPAGKTVEHAVALFPTLREQLAQWSGEWRGRQEVYYRAVKRVLRAQGIDIAQPLHGFRHTLVTDLRAAGVPLEDVARWVGHSQAGKTWGMITGTYDHAHLETLQRVAVAIQQLWNQLTLNMHGTRIEQEMEKKGAVSGGFNQCAHK